MADPVRPDSRTASIAGGGTARLMFYALLSISLMALDYRGQYVERFRNAAGQLVEPLFWAVDAPFKGLQRLSDLLATRAEFADRVRALERELALTRARLGRIEDLEVENARLRGLLGAARRIEVEFTAAELTGVNLDPFAHRILIRRGRRDGIRPGMPVVDDFGVLGQVDRVFRNTAEVVLISDPDHALPVQILPTGERTIAYGSGSLDRLRLTDLPMNTAIAEQDLVVTSGIGGRFPPGLPVARVVEITRQPGRSFASATARPLAEMDRNRFVLLLETIGPTEPPVSTTGEADADETGDPPAAASEDRSTGPTGTDPDANGAGQ